MRKKKHSSVNRHHRKPKFQNGTGYSTNISVVDTKKHQAWHTLFNCMTAPEIVKVINDVWLDPEYEFICRRLL